MRSYPTLESNSSSVKVQESAPLKEIKEVEEVKSLSNYESQRSHVLTSSIRKLNSLLNGGNRCNHNGQRVPSEYYFKSVLIRNIVYKLEDEIRYDVEKRLIAS